jgi:hypothetical protein
MPDCPKLQSALFDGARVEPHSKPPAACGVGWKRLLGRINCYGLISSSMFNGLAKTGCPAGLLPVSKITFQKS